MSVPSALEPELAHYQRQFEEATAAATRLSEGLDPDHIAWRPAPDRWSIGECLEHLNVMAELYLAAIDPAIARGRANGMTGRGPFRRGWLVNRFFIRALEPPARIRLKAPAKFRPPDSLDPSGAHERFLALQGDLIERTHQANGLHLSRIKVASPVTRLLRMSLGQAFAVVAVHQRRHLLQATNVREEKAFPGA